MIEAQSNANDIKIGHDYRQLVNHWDYRFEYYLEKIKDHGFIINQVTDPELCEELRDPIFSTDCNDFPDWRRKKHLGMIEKAYETYKGRKENLRELIEIFEDELKEMN